ncbi:glycohydrolase toxin TNT-related protein [Saccharopolyspora sp. HNM0986]|uniref:TNT domain-containing protein n=1 Tax=Saccharopolyspora galaxeae TaxID=2781241 RepID=UPI00190D033B|nr:TNT domain-containing protein [Saccharopolyspora sp. HNM0986]MBK0870703.1 glycohydrolase toxin TNT-related protein [Saccharopolyspora sp. HNM0986]
MGVEPPAPDGKGPAWQAEGEHTGPVSIGSSSAGSAAGGWRVEGVDPASVTAPRSLHQAWSAMSSSAPAGQGRPGSGGQQRGSAQQPAFPQGWAPGPPVRPAQPAQPPVRPGQPGGQPNQAGQQAPGAPAPHPGQPAVGQRSPYRARQAGYPGAPYPPNRPPYPQPPRAEQAAAPGHRQGEHKETVAFMLHQFPIGHLPVAQTNASRQLPDPGAARRFGPLDHPRSELVGDRDALARVRSGKLPPPDARGAASRPEDFTADHEPLAELSEHAWDREYRSTGSDYRWPPDEFPEGCTEAGEPIVLDPDTVLDELGDGEGRVAAPEGTAFTERSLPPEYLELPYHRYRVLHPLPVWRAVTAPWFGARGGGVRYRTTHPLAELVALGLLAELAPALEETGTIRLERSTVQRAETEAGTARMRAEPAAAREEATEGSAE